MKRLITYIILSVWTVTLVAQNIGGDYYVAHPDSAYAGMGAPSDLNDGSFANPWATLKKALETAQTGDTVYFRGGTYYTTGNSAVANSGTYEAPICWFGYPGEDVIFDAFYNCDHLVNTVYNGVIYINRKEHLYFKNFTIRNVFQCDSVNSGAITMHMAANMTFEQITLHNIGSRAFDGTMGSGVYGDYYNEEELAIDGPPLNTYDTTRFINCDVYDVFDTLALSPGNASDAWKMGHYAGNYVEWIGCRAWNYGDDGWDPNSATSSYERGSTTDGIPATRVFDNCWAMASNKYRNPGSGWQTERNAFKLANRGGDDGLGYNSTIMTNCLMMFSNSGIGEIYPSNQRGLFYNNTIYKCGTGYFFGGDKQLSIFINNIIYGSKNIVSGTIDTPAEIEMGYNRITGSHNTWEDYHEYPNWTYSTTVTVTDEDFVYTDSLTLVEMFTAPRNADGSLPPFPLKLSDNSDLIDMGMDVGLPYRGNAPDIGAYETGTINIELLYPENDSKYNIGDNILIEAHTSDPDHSIAKVIFRNENNTFPIGIGESDGDFSIWRYSWKTDTIGLIDLRAIAINDNGESATSSRVNIKILPGGTPNKEDGYCEIRYDSIDSHPFLVILSEIKAPITLNIVSLNGHIKHIERIYPNDSPIFDLHLPNLTADLYLLKLISEDGSPICSKPLIIY